MSRRIRRPVGYADLAGTDEFDEDIQLPDEFDSDDVAAVCAYPVPELRKAVVAMRRRMGLVGGKPTRAQLVPLLLGHKFWDPDWGRMKAAIQGNMSLTELRGLRSETKQWHPPASKMTRDALIKYCYDTASALGWTWTMANRTQKKRVGRACEQARRPGQTKAAPRSVISKRGKPASTRKPSRYNDYVRRFMRDPVHRRSYPNATDRMREAAIGWQQTRTDRERIQRRREDDAERRREAGERSAAYVAEIERGRKRRREAAAGRPAKRARATPVTRKRSRAAAADDSDSDDEEITVAELRAQLREQRAEVDRIRRQWKRDGLGDKRGKKRKPGQ
jgi:Arc/MetJ-type ribon-helix-helix transcriptional regulator